MDHLEVMLAQELPLADAMTSGEGAKERFRICGIWPQAPIKGFPGDVPTRPPSRNRREIEIRFGDFNPV